MEPGNVRSATQSHDSSEVEDGPARDDPATIGRYVVIRRLGQGGFGRVYLARDDDLDRLVAIKLPSPERVSGPDDVAAYIAEARALARLDHPHIVPVYDVGRTADGLCFVVSKYIDGSDLARRIARGRPTAREAAELVATIALALHHAHTRGLVHRDIKPANILIDTTQSPWVADFGLALKDEDYGKGARLAGTPSYMSPEQARGEGHRVDGRSDLFSLGVVLYELLTGRKPFPGETRAEVLDLITTADPRPPRQVDDGLSRELERICLKALAKRATERYSTGRDMAEDLQHYLQTELASAAPAVPGSTSAAAPLASLPATDPAPAGQATPSPQDASATPTPTRSDSDGRAVRIVPKGLRSFDRHDASFFLELLPGARDRDGLPESLRFWKTRIESTDPDATFMVGLIYGPSGCGKSSMVKAGLLPRLQPHVRAVYLEATPEETEARLLRGLRRACVELDTGLGLVDSLAAIRRGRMLKPGQKLVLVLDQFEQWLFARRAEAHGELAAALRQCDGDHVQAVIMVRDDFWMAATRFMRELEIRIVEGENSAAVDLFDLLHARRVLAAFGRAYGVLPEKSSEVSADQKAFLEQSVAGLAHEGKVIPVWLALFAEMVKGKPWTTATLRDVGGARGIGLTFLEETFTAATAPPEHRLHQRAAQAILKALLPGTGADIKGQMRSEAELREASGYANHPRSFDDVIGILDRELRLITPTDPEGTADEPPAALAGHRFYQLSHDYLVPSLREWLTRKQRKTRRGRAEIRLSERAAIWETRPEVRHLPSVAEWLSIRTLTRSRDWSEPERRMMRSADQIQGLRALAMFVGIVAILIAGLEIERRVAANRVSQASLRQAAEEEKRNTATARLKHLLGADIALVETLIPAIGEDRRWIDGELRRVAGDTLVDPGARLRASLALLPVDRQQVSFLAERLPSLSGREVRVLRNALEPYRDELVTKLWPQLESAGPADGRVLPVAAALAAYDTADPRWPGQAGKIAQALVKSDAGSLETWLELLRPLRAHLVAPLAAIFHATEAADSARELATRSLVEYASDDPSRLADLLMDADPKAFASLFAVAEKQEEKVASVLHDELARKPGGSWHDPPPDSSWTPVEAATARAIDSAQGRIENDFAFCQSMPLAELAGLTESLKKSGYRPMRCRPYGDAAAPRVAAVWTRDRRASSLDLNLTAEQARKLERQRRSENLVPVDVAGYLVAGNDGQPVDRYVIVWAAAAGKEAPRLYVGVPADDEPAAREELSEQGLSARTIDVLRTADGRSRMSSVWDAPPPREAAARIQDDVFEPDLVAMPRTYGDAVLLDAVVAPAGSALPAAERARRALARGEKVLATDPENPEARRQVGKARLRLGQPEKALAVLQLLGDPDDDGIEGLLYRSIAHARLGRKPEALADLAVLQKAYAPTSLKSALSAVVAAELGEGDAAAIQAVETAMAQRPDDPEGRYNAAWAFSLASLPAGRHDAAQGRRLAGRALEILEKLAGSRELDHGRIDDDLAFDPIRDDPRYAALLNRAHAERRYAAVLALRNLVECRTIAGADPNEQLVRARELAKDGFRPVAWSVAGTQTPVAVSVWHRPLTSDDEKDRLARRQARAAAALVRMGRGDEVWPLLRHDPDPRLRSFLVNWLEPLEVKPKVVAQALARLDAGDRGSAPTSEMTETALFDRDRSMRRALILALGTYSRDAMAAGDKDELAARLLRLYEHDADAGIHGAAAWTLSRFSLDDRVAGIDARLKGLPVRDDRSWFVNRQGQTFTVIEGPRAFPMGASPTDVESDAVHETARRVAIPRRYAIAAREVSYDEFEQFARTHRKYKLDRSVEQQSRGPDAPRSGVNWYGAAAYCNWLSEQDGLDPSQWCYQPSASGSYDAGMTIPANVHERTGYRLPTEAEWEYACRAGALTSRYYGTAADLLTAYACYGTQLSEKCGRRLPNDLGLFDMLGNLYEWCLDRDVPYRPKRDGIFVDQASSDEVLIGKRMRIFRGGSYASRRDELRSSARQADVPTYLGDWMGFRVARTVKP